MFTLYTTYSTQFFVYLDDINKLVYQTNADRFKLSLIKLYTGNANWAAYFIPTKRMSIYGRPLGAKWNTAVSVCLGFPSWCNIFATVPVHVSLSTHLTCLTYALTIFNFCRSSGRLSEYVCLLLWSLPEDKQQNLNASFCSSSQLFLRFMRSFS